jgi:hypothetical protein
MKMIDKIKEYIGEAQASQHRTCWTRSLELNFLEVRFKRVFAEFKNVQRPKKDLDK